MKPLSYHLREIQELGLAAFWKKVFNLALRIYQPLGTTFLFVTLRLLRPWVWVRVGYIDTTRVGHHLLITSFFVLASQEKRNPKGKPYFDIYFPGVRNLNPYLLRMWRRKLRVWPWWMVGGGVPNKFITRENLFNRGHLLRRPDLKEGMRLVRQNPPQLTLSSDELVACRNQMEELGLPSGEPWVALNIRDSAWLDLVTPSLEWRKNSYRDSDSDTYALACQRLLDRGLFVVRVGALVNKRVPIAHPNFIDYPFTRARSELLDLYLTGNCKFMISTGTGIDRFAFLSGVPLLFVNYEPSCLFSGHGGPHKVIFKNYLSKTKEKLRLSEIIDLQLLEIYDNARIRNLGISFEDNTSEEIAEAAEDMCDWVSSGMPLKEKTDLQKQVISIVKSRAGSCVDLKSIPEVNDGYLQRNPHWSR